MSNIKDDEHKYNEGDIVWALEAPNVKLVVRRYIDRIYYCKAFEDLEKKRRFILRGSFLVYLQTNNKSYSITQKE